MVRRGRKWRDVPKSAVSTYCLNMCHPRLLYIYFELIFFLLLNLCCTLDCVSAFFLHHSSKPVFWWLPLLVPAVTVSRPTCVSSRHSRKCVTLLKLMTEFDFFFNFFNTNFRIKNENLNCHSR